MRPTFSFLGPFTHHSRALLKHHLERIVVEHLLNVILFLFTYKFDTRLDIDIVY